MTSHYGGRLVLNQAVIEANCFDSVSIRVES